MTIQWIACHERKLKGVSERKLAACHHIKTTLITGGFRDRAYATFLISKDVDGTFVAISSWPLPYCEQPVHHTLPATAAHWQAPCRRTWHERKSITRPTARVAQTQRHRTLTLQIDPERRVCRAAAVHLTLKYRCAAPAPSA